MFVVMCEQNSVSMEIDGPISKYHNVFIFVLVCMGLVRVMDNKGSAETVSVLTLWE